jgi:hypothetical protein
MTARTHRSCTWRGGLFCIVVFCCLVGLSPVQAAKDGPLSPEDGKIGIFDLKAIRAVPLEAEVVAHREEDGIAVDEIRYTSRPGVRVFAILTYPQGKKRSPLMVFVRNAGAETRKVEAKNGFATLSVCAPANNRDPNKKLSTGGPPFNQFFTDDPEQSWYYHHVVALVRGLDYLETRAEVDMKNGVVIGFSTSGYVASLLHAVENRPRGYYTWHGCGPYVAPDGTSAGKPSTLSRKHYEMYCPAAYARYGASPIVVATALNDYYSILDAQIEFFANLRCPKTLAVAPNRGHDETSRKELNSSYIWQLHWQFFGPKPANVTDGTLTARAGRLWYSFKVASAKPPTFADVLFSYGKPGHWVGRTWHRVPAVKAGGSTYECEIPVYDPAMPLYALAQIQTDSLGTAAVCPQLLTPQSLGITAPTATYPKMLFDFEEPSDLYVQVGRPAFVPDAPMGKMAAAIAPFADGTVQLLNIEPFFWKGAKELRFKLKGDGNPGPVEVYFAADRGYWDFPRVTLVAPEATFEAGWNDYSIPLDGFVDLAELNCLVFVVPGRQTLLIDGVRWE